MTAFRIFLQLIMILLGGFITFISLTRSQPDWKGAAIGMAIIIVMLVLMFLLRPKNKTAAEKERSEKRNLMVLFIVGLIMGVSSIIFGGGILFGFEELNRPCNFTGKGAGLCLMILNLSLWLTATFGETTARAIMGPIWMLLGLLSLYWAYLFHQEEKSERSDR
jgi:tryptophan-rich sensory protein